MHRAPDPETLTNGIRIADHETRDIRARCRAEGFGFRATDHGIRNAQPSTLCFFAFRPLQREAYAPSPNPYTPTINPKPKTQNPEPKPTTRQWVEDNPFPPCPFGEDETGLNPAP